MKPRNLPPARPPLVPEQLVVGTLGAGLLALLDGARLALGDLASERSAGEVALAVLHTIAFYLPAGIVTGLAAAGLIAILRASAPLGPLRMRLASPPLWFAPAPKVTARVLGALSGVAVVALVARTAYGYLATSAHRVDLAEWTMAAIMVGGVAAGFLAGTAVGALLSGVTSRAGRLASPGAIAILLGAASAYAASEWLSAHPEIVEVYGLALAAVAAAVLAYATCAIALRRVFRRYGGAAPAAAAALALASLAWVTSALTYGQANAVRGLVEEGSAGGRFLLRRYTRVTDLDGDRHSWGFGGRDCDDLDARVHPGTLDEPGDGIDLDCFAGDGAPVVERPGDGAFGAVPPSLTARPNFVLVTIDALRPDHLGVEGYARDTSPNIDAFAGTAVRFREVLAPSSRSIRSIPAMFTGLYPSQIAYGDEYLYPALLAENTTVAEVLDEHGWQTAVTMGTEYFHRVRGFYQGFRDVEEVLHYRPPREQTVDRALVQLDRLVASGEPFFQWIHLFHVHEPYLSPPHPSRYGPESVDHYDTEIHLADEQLQRVLTALTRRGLDESTVVIVASDHGEAFREHGRRGHANTLYEEEVQAVMMLRVPGVQSRRVEASVSLLDLTPTVLNLARIEVPHPISGRSLVPLATGESEPDPERWFFGELLPDGMFPFDIKSIRRGRMKLHWWVRDGTIQMFDLEADPGERRDISDQREREAEELLGTLQAWVARSSRAQHRDATFVHQHLLSAPPAGMTHPLSLRYPGLFTVLGCDVPQTRITVGETLPVTCYYRVDAETDSDLFFRVMLDGPHGYTAPRDMHAMHYPLHGRYHTNQWRAGEIIRDPIPIPIPSYAGAPVDLWLTFAIEARDAQRRRYLLSFEQHGRPGTSSRITRIRLSPADSPAADASTGDASSRDAGPPPAAAQPPEAQPPEAQPRDAGPG